jgi:DNA-binding GntR family transcriptional regulator
MGVTWSDFVPRRSLAPYYRQLAGYIQARIDAGDLKAGDGLPSERELADLTGVSVDTVRAAYGVLREDGKIATAKGIGSFVA